MSRRSRMQAQDDARRRRIALFTGLGAIVVIAAVVAVLVSGGDDGKVSTSGAQTRPVSVTGTGLPTFAGAPDGGVGMTVPTLTGQSFSGQPVRIEPDGKPKVLIALAHWCPHCQREVPLLSANIRANPLPPNLEVIAVSTSVQPSAPNYPPERWLEREDWPSPVLADDARGTAGKALGLSSFPYFVFVDSAGKVVSRYAGEMPVDQFRATVARLTGG